MQWDRLILIKFQLFKVVFTRTIIVIENTITITLLFKTFMAYNLLSWKSCNSLHFSSAFLLPTVIENRYRQ